MEDCKLLAAGDQIQAQAEEGTKVQAVLSVELAVAISLELEQTSVVQAPFAELEVESWLAHVRKQGDLLAVETFVESAEEVCLSFAAHAVALNAEEQSGMIAMDEEEAMIEEAKTRVNAAVQVDALERNSAVSASLVT